jgi:hypothetical protein
MAKKFELILSEGEKKAKKIQEKEDAEFLKMLQSDAGTKLLGDEKKMRKLMNKTDKYLGLKF